MNFLSHCVDDTATPSQPTLLLAMYLFSVLYRPVSSCLYLVNLTWFLEFYTHISDLKNICVCIIFDCINFLLLLASSFSHGSRTQHLVCWQSKGCASLKNVMYIIIPTKHLLACYSADISI